MRAQEEDREGVVVGTGGTRLGLGAGDDLAPRARGVGAYDVEEAPPRGRDEPSLQVARRLVGTERAHRVEQRVLHGVLGRREVGSATDEDADHLRDDLPQGAVVDQSPVAVGAP